MLSARPPAEDWSSGCSGGGRGKGGGEGGNGGEGGTPAPAESKPAPLPRPIPLLGEKLNVSHFLKVFLLQMEDGMSCHNIAAFQLTFSSNFGLKVGGCEAGVSFGLCGCRRWLVELPVVE